MGKDGTPVRAGTVQVRVDTGLCSMRVPTQKLLDIGRQDIEGIGIGALGSRLGTSSARKEIL